MIRNLLNSVKTLAQRGLLNNISPNASASANGRLIFPIVPEISQKIIKNNLIVNNFNGSTRLIHTLSKAFEQTLLKNPVRPLLIDQNRNVTKWSRGKGRRKTVKTVVQRFFRLNWGIWIRPIGGRNRFLWRKHEARKARYRNHIFCNASQTEMLDKMVSRYWRKPKYWVDDPYEIYQKRENFEPTSKRKFNHIVGRDRYIS